MKEFESFSTCFLTLHGDCLAKNWEFTFAGDTLLSNNWKTCN